jgi:hypothetical protein
MIKVCNDNPLLFLLSPPACCHPVCASDIKGCLRDDSAFIRPRDRDGRHIIPIQAKYIRPGRLPGHSPSNTLSMPCVRTCYVDSSSCPQDIQVTGLIILLCDHVGTFSLERHLIWAAPRSLPKYAFLLNRYLVPPSIVIAFIALSGFSGLSFPGNVSLYEHSAHGLPF